MNTNVSNNNLDRLCTAASATTNYHSSTAPPYQCTPQPEATIFGYTMRWPQFQTKNALFEGNHRNIKVSYV